MLGFIKKIFDNKSDPEPSLVFGRYTDFYKAKSKYAEWDAAMLAHDKKQYMMAIEKFLAYVYDENVGNVVIEKISEEKLRFQIYQGSKMISGFSNQDGFFAESKIALCTDISLGAFRMLLEENYHLLHCSYALDSENYLVIVIHADHLDASPYKLYYGLKELATRADRRDDVMVRKFTELKGTNNGYISHISDSEKKIKYDYLKSEIKKVFDFIDKDNEKLRPYPGLVSYMILATSFLFDYLLKPEGMTMEHIENIHKIFFHINTISPEKKNADMLKELKLIDAIDAQDFYNELYVTKSTFGNLISGSHKRLQEMVDDEMKHYDWYIQNGFSDYALFIPKYIASLLLYTYSMPLPDKQLLHLLLNVLENEFFTSLGYVSLIDHQKINTKLISKKFEQIEAENTEMYPEFAIDTNGIDFNDKLSFAYTFLKKIYSLNLTRK